MDNNKTEGNPFFSKLLAGAGILLLLGTATQCTPPPIFHSHKSGIRSPRQNPVNARVVSPGKMMCTGPNCRAK